MSRRSLIHVALLVGAVLAAPGCLEEPDDSDSDDDSMPCDADVDSDSDVDSDTDGDSDTDSDSDEIVTFERAFGEEDLQEYGADGALTSDGGYVALGYIDYGWEDLSAVLIAVDSTGEELWSTEIEDECYQPGFLLQPEAIAQSADGGFVVTGYEHCYPSGYHDLFLIKVDAEGAVEWHASYDFGYRDTGFAVTQLDDGGYAVAGNTCVDPSEVSDECDDYDVLVLRVGDDGDEFWSETVSGYGWYEAGFSVLQTADGGIAVGGRIQGPTNSSDFYLLRLDGGGNEIWSQTYGGEGSEYAYGMVATADGGFVLAGETSSFGVDNWEGYVVRADAAGEESWSLVIPEPTSRSSLSAVCETGDGGFAVAGHTCADSSGNSCQAMLVKIDGDGDKQWTRTFGSPWVDRASSVLNTADGGFYLVGTTSESPNPNRQIHLIKTDASGYVY